MTVFEAVKQTVTSRQAAENYGIDVNRAGKAQCPFHNDRTPSMKVDKRFHCFGCGADGDVIDFTAKLYGLDAKSAADERQFNPILWLFFGIFGEWRWLHVGYYGDIEYETFDRKMIKPLKALME